LGLRKDKELRTKMKFQKDIEYNPSSLSLALCSQTLDIFSISLWVLASGQRGRKEKDGWYLDGYDNDIVIGSRSPSGGQEPRTVNWRILPQFIFPLGIRK
jgi:hypothetical protein